MTCFSGRKKEEIMLCAGQYSGPFHVPVDRWIAILVEAKIQNLINITSENT